MSRMFKYYPTDFGELTVKVEHFDLFFDIFDDHTTVVSTLHAHVLAKPIKELILNAKEMQIHDVTGSVPLTWKYKSPFLHVTFTKPLKAKTQFTITSKHTIIPSKNVLEGLYYDETPAGAPPTQITQCQQWGFQRLVPCIDDMTAKCTYTTTICADSRYTNLITNGDLVKGPVPIDKVSIDQKDNKKDKKYQKDKKDKSSRVEVIYKNTKTPMATYLFFLGVGTYATFTRILEYPSGRSFTLELLVPPKTKADLAQKALEILHDSILWIHLFTGPDRYKNEPVAQELWSLLKEREERRAAKKDVRALATKIKELAKGHHWGYSYTGTVYREIGMQNSDFGGMENVGNTTITTNRIIPFAEMTDRGFEYLMQVKVHEFYHNLNGSEVTGRSPFEIWLNEAVTVFIELGYHTFHFGNDYSRLQRVLTLLSPEAGTLTQDVGAASLPIEPEGFNDPNELITSITYVKAPEFVRMIETMLGREVFNKGLNLYYQRYKHSNATRQQWIACMEEVSGVSLQAMATTWLKKTGYPIVKVEKRYDVLYKRLVVTLTQVNAKENDFWTFPFQLAACDENGNVLYETTVMMDALRKEVTFLLHRQPAFLSCNKGYSFYGKVEYATTRQELFLQVRKEKDIVGRFLAWYQLIDQEKMRLLKAPSAEVDKSITDLYLELLCDSSLMMSAGAQFLAIFEAVDDEKYAHRYQELFTVKKKILSAIAHRYTDKIISLYDRIGKEKVPTGTYLDQQSFLLKQRSYLLLCLGLLAQLDTKAVHSELEKQIGSTNATTRLTALRLLLNSNAPRRHVFIKEEEKLAAGNLVRWETYLLTLASCDTVEVFDYIKRAEESPHFRIEQTNDQRALYATFANNRKMSLQTTQGRALLKRVILKLAFVNEYTTGRLLQVFGNVDKMEEKYHVPIVQMLVDILHAVPVEKAASVHNTTKRLLKGLPLAVAAYEKEKGKIKELKEK
ncbi:DUF3458 domain-containing protein [Candidatus Woesearchaeota archaeon]|nr:DUF3458 domain-containing protein [Candidatus Woesearchaeota archaeon]